MNDVFKVTIVFNKYDDLCEENRNYTESTCLNVEELPFVRWNGNVLTFITRRSLKDVIEGFEFECFNADEFDEVKYTKC